MRPSSASQLSADVRNSHESGLIKLIAEHKTVSKPELSRLSGLSRPTVDDIVNGFLNRGFVRQSGETQGRLGRKATLFELDPQVGLGLGFDLGGSKLSTALVNAAGQILDELTEPTAIPPGSKTIEQMIDNAKKLCSANGVSLDAIKQVSVGTPGILNADGQLLLGENVNDLEGIHLQRVLGHLLAAPVEIDNDVNMAAIGEYYHGTAQGCENFALLQVGTGIGCGIFINGKLVKGSKGGAGEVAFLPMFGDYQDPNAQKNGLLESVVGSKAIVASYNQTAEHPVTSVKEVFERFKGSDQIAIHVVDDVAKYLGHACAAISAVLDPEVIVLAGGIGSDSLLLPRIQEWVVRLLPYSVNVLQSSLGSRSGVVGAGSAAAANIRKSLIEKEHQSHG